MFSANFHKESEPSKNLNFIFDLEKKENKYLILNEKKLIDLLFRILVIFFRKTGPYYFVCNQSFILKALFYPNSTKIDL